MAPSITEKRLYRVGVRPLDGTVEEVQRLAETTTTLRKALLPLQTRTYADATERQHGLS